MLVVIFVVDLHAGVRNAMADMILCQTVCIADIWELLTIIVLKFWTVTATVVFFFSIYLISARFFFLSEVTIFRCEVDALSYICFIQSFISMFNMMLSNHNMCPKRKQRSKNNKSTLTIYIFGGGCMGGVMFSVFMLVFVSFMYGLPNEMRRSLCAWYA